MARIRNALITLNNPDDAEQTFWETLSINQRVRDRLQVGYMIYQEELGANGTRHYQIYVEFKRAIRLAGIKRRLGSRIHIERRRGTQAQAIAYCSKVQTRVENGDSGEGGEAKKLGKDSLGVVMATLAEGADLPTVSADYPVTFVKHGQKIISYRLSQLGPRNGAPSVHIIYGKTGIGKTAWAKKKWPNAYWVPKPKKGGWWWFNYTGQTTIIIDEFNSSIKYTDWLRLCDRYQYVVQQKGSMCNMVATTIVFTTNTDPIEWYPNKSFESKTALRRRLRDFATIYDFADDSTWDDIKYTIRPTIVV